MAPPGAGAFRTVTFLNEQTGFGADEQGAVWASIDGGRSWLIRSENGRGILDHPLQIEFLDDWHGWALTEFGVWRTEDGGATWRGSSLQYPDGPARGARLHFNSLESGGISDFHGAIQRTEDGGKTWTWHLVAPSKAAIPGLFFTDQETGWLCTEAGEIYRSVDSGATWEPQRGPIIRAASFGSIQFISNLEGWVCGAQKTGTKVGAWDDYKGILLHTMDGGQSWERIDVESEDFPATIAFTDSKVGWGANDPGIFITDDGGVSWKRVLSFSK